MCRRVRSSDKYVANNIPSPQCNLFATALRHDRHAAERPFSCTHPRDNQSQPVDEGFSLTLTVSNEKQKAEILKLRLSLATYKVKTNQTDVPLDKLQILPMPGMARQRTPLPSMSAHTIERTTPAQYWYRSSARKPSLYAPINHYPADDSDKDEEDKIDIPDREAAEEDLETLPKLTPSDAALTTPRKNRSEADEEKLTSSALRGGAAKGLLSLSQGSH